eukprot:scaffold98_cov244-Pinguiococcus_pyrenoidosus.AAC.3
MPRFLGHWRRAWVKCRSTCRYAFSSEAEKDAASRTARVRRRTLTPARKSVEETYTRLDAREHVLLRPGMYLGSVTPQKLSDHVLRRDKTGMEKRDLLTLPALLKAFDEILVNALDNARRGRGTKRIDVYWSRGRPHELATAPPLDDETALRRAVRDGVLPCITVVNDGQTVPVQMHRDEEMLVPELVFGQLQSGSNFDDNEERYTGGRHGLGAKLTNIFSLLFEVEIFEAPSRKHFLGAWIDNMGQMASSSTASIPDDGTLMSAGAPRGLAGELGYSLPDPLTSFTRISFVPDLLRLGLGEDPAAEEYVADAGGIAMNQDTFDLLEKRVWDAAATTMDVDIALNGEIVPRLGFVEYAKLFVGDAGITHLPVNKNWDVCLAACESGDAFDVSFVNGMYTALGGSHVECVKNQAVAAVVDACKDLRPTAAYVKNRLQVFVSCAIANPEFDSQRKERLLTPQSQFKPKCALKRTHLAAFLKESSIIDKIKSALDRNVEAAAAKSFNHRKQKQLTGIRKLEDAHDAGGAKSDGCTLILTEGDSAKAFAIAGLEVLGREKFGVFPLRGKIKNVRGVKKASLTKIEEVSTLCKILGLSPYKQYDSHRSPAQMGLRYGAVMIMADQDDDGCHIRGLVVNLFASLWPELLSRPGFLQSFRTPLLKVDVPGKSASNKRKGFFSRKDFEDWLSTEGAALNRKLLRVKYYKGLGTSTPAEAREYCEDLSRHRYYFAYTGQGDEDALDLAFNKERPGDRRDWLAQTPWSASHEDALPADLGSDASDIQISYETFVHSELSRFSMADNVRSLPSVVDGLKPSQRKVLYACLKRNLTSEIKVAQLAGYCSEHTAYHHGEASLHSTIIGMAQDFCGANNINLLVPDGGFGTRHAGGKDAGAPRYIYTKLSQETRLLFPKGDDPLLEYLTDDGMQVEPRFFVPVIPILLINGAVGIGTGWSTEIPMYNPRDVIKSLRSRIERDLGVDAEMPVSRLVPWYRGFKGEITMDEETSKIMTQGVATRRQRSATIVDITELPIGRLHERMVATLEKLMESGVVTSYKIRNTSTEWHYEVKLSKGAAKKRNTDSEESLRSLFRLTSNIVCKFHAFDADGHIRDYGSAEAIMEDYYRVRADLYARRYRDQISQLEGQILRLENKDRFLKEVSDGTLKLYNVELEDVRKTLIARDYARESDIRAILLRERDGSADVSDPANEYDYLLRTNFLSATAQKRRGLQRELDDCSKELAMLQSLEPLNLWLNDLDALEEHMQG